MGSGLAGLICSGLYPELPEHALERRDGSVVWVLAWDSVCWVQVPAPPQILCGSSGKSLSVVRCLHSPSAKWGGSAYLAHWDV